MSFSKRQFVWVFFFHFVYYLNGNSIDGAISLEFVRMENAQFHLQYLRLIWIYHFLFIAVIVVLLTSFKFLWKKNQADTDCTKGHLGDQQLTIQHKRHKILLFNIINIHLLAACVYCVICFSFQQCRFSFLFRQVCSKISQSLSHAVSQSGKEYTVIVITMNFNQETWQFYLNYDSQFVAWWV